MNAVDFTETATAVREDALTRRRRHDRPAQAEVLPPAPKLEDQPDRQLTRNFAVIAHQIEDVLAERDSAKRELAEAKARIEQFQSRVTELTSQLETARVTLEDEQRKRIELQAAWRIVRQGMDAAAPHLVDDE